MRARGREPKRRAATPTVFARLNDRVRLEAQASGEVLACSDGNAVSLGRFSADTAHRAAELRVALPLDAFAPTRRKVDQEFDLLVRRLASQGLLQYGLTHDGAELVTIEPQVVDYWPQMPSLNDADALVLSRFAYMRRRGNEIVVESPRAGALFRIHDPAIATVLARLATPQQVKQLRKQEGFPGLPFLALLVDGHILLKNDADENALRPAKGDRSPALWDFHDLLFHARSTGGRHANPIGGTYPHSGAVDPLPAVRPRWPGKAIELPKIPTHSEPVPFVKLLRDRHSTRSFDTAQHPMTLPELSEFLDASARILSKSQTASGSPAETAALRPYPSGGASYELELYVAVNRCEELARGFYHYDADAHALVPISVSGSELEALFANAQYAMGAPAPPPILITIAARFGRVSWKYSSIAYSLILKDVGVLTQTFYLTATSMGLGGCAVGIVNVDLFAKMTGIEFQVEGPVGQFALGRPAQSEPPAENP